MDAPNLITAQIVEVAFVKDYIQLRFENPFGTINIFSNGLKLIKEETVEQSSPDFNNKLIALIDKTISSQEFIKDKYIQLQLSDNTILQISLLPDDYTGPEAAYITVGKQWWVY